MARYENKFTYFSILLEILFIISSGVTPAAHEAWLGAGLGWAGLGWAGLGWAGLVQTWTLTFMLVMTGPCADIIIVYLLSTRRVPFKYQHFTLYIVCVIHDTT